jgi:hypothetical protein
MTDDEIFELLGDEIARNQRMSTSITSEQKKEMGRKWLIKNIDGLREKVCGNKTIEDLASKSDTVTLIATLAPLLMQQPIVSHATIATILARIGLRRFCNAEWAKAS